MSWELSEGFVFRLDLVIAILGSRNGWVSTKVLNAPDVSVSRFFLRLDGGKRGLITNSVDLCRYPQRASLNLIGQNGRRYKTKPVVGTSCKGKKGKKRVAHRRR